MNVFSVHAFEQLLKDRYEIAVQAVGCLHFVRTHYEVPECSHDQSRDKVVLWQMNQAVVHKEVHVSLGFED